ncbi:hypothetical protein AAG570_001247 [Ranatra chinensis]|uniref:Uncharacterized protein n=1 Tax=Ranatra chinensis TaxID=642074 RepID=A0ABD0YBB1_9HEMI
MASKRRNMIYQNKKQETTEIDACNLPPFCDCLQSSAARWSVVVSSGGCKGGRHQQFYHTLRRYLGTVWGYNCVSSTPPSAVTRSSTSLQDQIEDMFRLLVILLFWMQHCSAAAAVMSRAFRGHSVWVLGLPEWTAKGFRRFASHAGSIIKVTLHLTLDEGPNQKILYF